VLYNLGVAYFKKELYEKAVFQFERYLELKPDADNREETERIIEELRGKLKESERREKRNQGRRRVHTPVFTV